MTKREEVFPQWMFDALCNASAQGTEIAVFESESECAGERLKFYRFLAAMRASGDVNAAHCAVQWLRAPGTNSKRILRFNVARATANPLASGNKEEIEQE